MATTDEIIDGLLRLYDKGAVVFYLVDGEFISALSHLPVPDDAITVTDKATIIRFLKDEARIANDEDN